MQKARISPFLSRLTIVATLLFVSLPAASRARHRLGSRLRHLAATRVTSKNLDQIGLNGFFKVFEKRGRFYARVIAEVDPQADELLESLGVERIRRHGPVITAEVPLTILDRLAEVQGIRSMRIARRLNMHLDLSVPTLSSGSIGLEVDRTPVQESGYLTYPPTSWNGTSGAGVTWGLVDSGIDPYHEDFEDDYGDTRIQFIWDQNTSTYWTASQINSSSCTHADTNGHGTHVAGTGAGSGRASGNGLPDYRYVGVAPEADIVAVATDFTDAGVIDGAAYVFEKAQAAGQPAVVNMSLGGHYGPHDGTDPVEVGIDALCGPGRVVVISAGNEGADKIHDGGNWDGSSIDLDINVSSSGATLGVTLWHNGLDSYRVRVTKPGGSSATWEIGDSLTKRISGTQVYVDNPEAGEAEYNGDKEIYFEMYSLNSGGWTISLLAGTVSSSDPDRADAWIFYDSKAGYPYYNPSYFTNSDNTYSVGSPGTAKEVLSIAAYASRYQWPSIDGSWYNFDPHETPEEICSFSSLGPSRDGRQKPDITAPGSIIVSALSADTYYYPSDPYIVPDGVHTIMEGTSMSCPHISGLAALLLAQHPTYTPAAIKSILAYRADRDTYVDSTPADDWGYGKAHATDALDQATDNLPRCATPGLEPEAPNPARADNTLVARGEGFVPQASAPDRYLYQWQEHNGDYYEDIPGAHYKRLEPQAFSSSEQLRLVVTPYQVIDTTDYYGLLLGASQLETVTVSSGSSYASDTGSEGWCMVSLPTQDDNAIKGDFTESLYYWDETDQAYHEATDIERGTGYWVEVMAGEGYMHSTGSAAPSGDYVTPALTYNESSTHRPGRHLLGNPFNKPIYWQNTYVSTDPGSFSMKVTDPGATALIENVYYADWDGTNYHYYDPDDFEECDGKIFPWQGFWVKTYDEVYLLIPETQDPPDMTPDPGPYPMYPRKMTSSAASRVARAAPALDPQVVNKPQRPADPEGWRVKISARSGDLGDFYNYVGIHPEASDAFDRLDTPDAGTMNSARHVMLYTQHTDWGRQAGRYCVDIQRAGKPRVSVRPSALMARAFGHKPGPQPLPVSGHRWRMLLRSRATEEPVSVSWRKLPSGWKLSLYDVAAGAETQMRPGGKYTFDPRGDEEERILLIEATPVD